MAQFHAVFDRQKEVSIGKRNINCLSCKQEPEKDHCAGTDGRIYRGKPRADQNQTDENGANSLTESNKKLLNMKWDHLGLSNYSQTFDFITKAKEADSVRNASNLSRTKPSLAAGVEFIL